MDFDKHPEPWKQSKHLFHEYLNMEEFGFKLDSNLTLIDMHGLSYFKTIKNNEYQIFISFDENKNLVHNFFCRIKIQEIENSVNEGIARLSSKIDAHETTISLMNENDIIKLYEKFVRISNEELKTSVDYKIKLKNLAEIIRSDCKDITIPLLEEWSDIEKIYKEIIIPICKEGEKVFGRDRFSDIIGGGYYSWLKVMYILHKYQDPFLHDFTKRFLNIYSPWVDFKEDIQSTIRFIRYLDIEYDFNEVESRL